MHPLIRLIATEPQLLADHAEAYASLVSAEFGTASSALKRRAVLGAAALCCLGAAAVLGGVALMFWGVVPLATSQAPWVLIVAPAVPAVLAIVCLLAARSSESAAPFDNVRSQAKADMAMLREMAAA